MKFRRILISVGVFLLFVLPILTYVTQYFYERFEGGRITLAQALLFVVETMTSTGYGELLPFHSWRMVLYTTVLIFVGFGTIFVLFATMAGNYVQKTLSELIPTRVPRNLRDHVLICTDEERGAVLAELLRDAKIKCLILTGDRDFAMALADKGFSVVCGNSDGMEAMNRVKVSSARAVVTDQSDESNMNASLAVRAVADTPIYATVDDPLFGKYMEHAGATATMPIKRALGEALAHWIVSPVPEVLSRTALRFPGLHFLEAQVDPHSELAERTLRELRFRDTTGATVLGLWRADSCIKPAGPDTVLRGNSVAVIMANDEQLERIKSIYGIEPKEIARPKAGERCIVAGSGHVGSQAAEELRKAGLRVSIINDIWKKGCDMTSHIAAEKMLEEAGIREASFLVVALNGDLRCLVVTLVARSLNPGIRIIGRTNADEYIPRLLLAGADHAISLSQVTSERLFNLIVGSTCPACAELTAVEVTAGPAMWGKPLSDLQILKATGCIAAAVCAQDHNVLSPGSDTVIPRAAKMVILGEPSQIEAFLAT